MTSNQIPAHHSTLPALLLFGMGGHGRVVYDASLLMHAWKEIFVSDRDFGRCMGPCIAGVSPIDATLAKDLDADVHISIGDNVAREREALAWNLDRLVSIVHPQSIISKFSQVGAGSFVAAGAVLAAGASIGVACIVNHGAVVDHEVRIGPYCHLAPLASLGGGVTLGKRVLVGAGAMILPGIEVGDDVVIGAGAVVRQPLFVPGTYVGVPARRVK